MMYIEQRVYSEEHRSVYRVTIDPIEVSISSDVTDEDQIKELIENAVSTIINTQLKNLNTRCSSSM